MKIFVITLPSAEERQQQAARQLEAAGVSYQFFPAVAGDQALAAGSCQLDDHQFVLATGRAPTAGEIGCFASHRLAWKMCVTLGEPIMVMEDDFALSSNFAGAYELVARRVYEFGYMRLQSERRAKKRKVRDEGAFTIWRYTKAPNSAMCYAITPDTANALLKHADVIRDPVDIYLKRFWEHGQVMYGVTPYSVTESNLSADSCIPGRVKAKKSLPTRLHRTAVRLHHYLSRQWFNVRKYRAF